MLSKNAAPTTKKLPHICFVAPQLWPAVDEDSGVELIGGAEVQQWILAQLLASVGYQVSIIVFDYGQPHRLVREGVTFFSTHHIDAGIPVLRFIHPRMTEMWRTLQEVDADIYYQRAAGIHTTLVASFCGRHNKLSIFAGACDFDFVPGKQMIRFARDRWLFERGLEVVDAVVVQNKMQQENCLLHYGRESMLIPSCYLPPKNARQGGGDEFILWVGMIRPSKRPDLFIELAKQLPDRKFVMVGGPMKSSEGGPESFYQIKAAAHEVPNLEMKGFLPLNEVEPLFDRAAVVVNTSDYEGMPNVFLQAWARAIPTVALIDLGARLDGEAPYVITANIDDMAVQVNKLSTDASHRADVGNRCQRYFENTHGPVGVLRGYTKVFESLVKEPRNYSTERAPDPFAEGVAENFSASLANDFSKERAHTTSNASEISR